MSKLCCCLMIAFQKQRIQEDMLESWHAVTV